MLQLINQSWGKKAVGNVPVPLTVTRCPKVLEMSKEYIREWEENFTVSVAFGGTGYAEWLILGCSQMDFSVTEAGKTLLQELSRARQP